MSSAVWGMGNDEGHHWLAATSLLDWNSISDLK